MMVRGPLPVRKYEVVLVTTAHTAYYLEHVSKLLFRNCGLFHFLLNFPQTVYSFELKVSVA